MLDDIRAPQAAEFTWLVQAPAVEIADAAGRRYRIAKESSACELVMASASPTTANVAASTAETKNKTRGWRQLQVKADGPAWRLATVFDAWKRQGLKVEMKTDGPDAATMIVTGPDFTDTWIWQCTPEEATPATLACERNGKTVIKVGPQDKAPAPAARTLQ